jgi:hypothetical protein
MLEKFADAHASVDTDCKTGNVAITLAHGDDHQMEVL